jgi:hypothetical protein
MNRLRGAVAALTLVVGCAQFQPTLPMRAQTMDVDLQLDTIRAGGAKELVYTSRSTQAHQIGRAWLTVASRVPCVGGAEADRILVDDGASAAGSLPPGSHEIRTRFAPYADDLRLDLVLDMEIESGGCLRAPAVSQSVPFDAPKRFVLTTSIDVGGNGDLGGMQATGSLRVGGGGWVGPLLVTAVVGFGGATCNETTCGRDTDNSLRDGLVIPAALDLRYSLGSHTSNGPFTNFLLVGARYSIMPTRLPALDGERRFLVHGIQGVLSWAMADAIRGPFLHKERMPLIELAVPVGVYWSPDVPTNHLVFAVGMDVRFLVPL